MITYIKKRAFIALFILFLFNSVFSQNRDFNGILLDSETNEPLVAATVELVNLEKHTTTDDNGKFSFHNIEHKKFSIKVNYLGYKEGIFSINCSDSKCSNLIFFLVPEAIEFSTVVVTDHNEKAVVDDLANLANVLSGRKLEKDLGVTLASTLKNETGLAMRSMGPAPSRPVLRGLGGDRVLISEDGNKTVDLSSTSPDHAVTIEPFSIERVEVIRGPKLLLQTSTTIGGVVNVVRNEIPTKIHDNIFGTIGAYGESVNSGYLGSLKFEIPLEPFEIRVDFSRRKTDDVSTPIGLLKNSYSENMNYSFGTGFIQDFGVIGGSFRGFELNYGVPGGFIGAHPNGVDIEMKKYQGNAKARIDIHGKDLQHLKIDFSSTYYRHKEFEKRGTIGSEFLINDIIGKINLDYINLFYADEGTIGVSSNYKDFKIGGFVFTPPTQSLNISTYIYQKYTFEDFQIDAAGRFNFDQISPQISQTQNYSEEVRKRVFTTNSLSFSLLYKLTERVSIGGNISKSSRVPTIEELFSKGPHLAAYSYEIGNPNLKAERGFGSEIFLYHDFKSLKINLNLFYNYLPYYIIPRNNGEINWATFLPIYDSEGVEALLKGGELQFDWFFIPNFKLNLSGSYTYGEIVKEKSPLPQIPPMKGLIGIEYSQSDINFGIIGEWATSQNRVDVFEEPTAGYFVVNAFGQYSFKTNSWVHNLSVSLDNIFNKQYRNHLSRVKVILPEAGFNARITYKLYFHL